MASKKTSPASDDDLKSSKKEAGKSTFISRFFGKLKPKEKQRSQNQKEQCEPGIVLSEKQSSTEQEQDALKTSLNTTQIQTQHCSDDDSTDVPAAKLKEHSEHVGPGPVEVGDEAEVTKTTHHDQSQPETPSLQLTVQAKDDQLHEEQKQEPTVIRSQWSDDGSLKARVVFNYKGCHGDELSVKTGDVVEIVKENTGLYGRWEVRLGDKVGLVPEHCLEKISPRSQSVRTTALLQQKQVTGDKPVIRGQQPVEPTQHRLNTSGSQTNVDQKREQAGVKEEVADLKRQLGMLQLRLAVQDAQKKQQLTGTLTAPNTGLSNSERLIQQLHLRRQQQLSAGGNNLNLSLGSLNQQQVSAGGAILSLQPLNQQLGASSSTLSLGSLRQQHQGSTNALGSLSHQRGGGSTHSLGLLNQQQLSSGGGVVSLGSLNLQPLNLQQQSALGGTLLGGLPLNTQSSTVTYSFSDKLIGRIITKHPEISGKINAAARACGVTIKVIETIGLIRGDTGTIRVTLSGAPTATALLRMEILSLDQKLRLNVLTMKKQLHCMIIPFLASPIIGRVVGEIERKHCIEIHLEKHVGNPIPVQQFSQYIPQKELLLTDLSDFNVIPSVPIPIDFDWRIEFEQGKFQELPENISKIFSAFDHISKSMKTDFVFNQKHYIVQTETMKATELSSGESFDLTKTRREPVWSYAVDDKLYVDHEAQDSKELERMYTYGGAHMTLAGARCTLDCAKMQQIDLKSGKKTSVKRSPNVLQAKSGMHQHLVSFKVRGLNAASITLAMIELQLKLESLCTTLTVTSDIMSSVPQDWHEIVLVHMVNTARQYCLKVGTSGVSNGKISIQLQGVKEYLDKVQIHLREQSLELQHCAMSQEQPMSKSDTVPVPIQQYPPEWEPQQQDFELFKVNHGSPEWTTVWDSIKATLPNVDIVRLERIQNKQLWDKYALEKKHMSDRNGGVINEKHLFHGTRNTNPNMIVKSIRGIDFRYSRQDCQLLWGTGAYFAVNASYSDAYSYVDIFQQVKQLLLVKVLTGNSHSYGHRTNPTLTKPPPLLFGGHLLYDTVNGYTNGSNVFVVYDHDRAYPAYLITYRH